MNIESPGDTCRLRNGTTLVDVEAAELALGPLADNGGRTRTHAPLPVSVALDAVRPIACNARSDQRGVGRPVGRACDVGAVEWQPPGTRILAVPSEYPEIQSAIDAAISVGDTILVSPGVYTGPLDFQSKDVTLVGTEGPESTIIDGSGKAAVTMGPLGALIGFTITNAEAANGAGVTVQGTGSLIEGNVFEGNRATGFGVAIAGNVASPTIDANVFRANACDGGFLDGVVTFINESSPMISNNIFESNDCTAINFVVPSSAAPRIIHNLVVANPLGIFIGTQVDTSAQIWRNNIVIDNAVGLEVTTDRSPTWEHNLVFANGTNFVGMGDPTGFSGNLSVEPLFVDQDGGDYHPLGASPVVEAGQTEPLVRFDFDGKPRAYDLYLQTPPATDIGPYEFQ